MRKNILERFWSKVDILENRAACWLWTGAMFTGGYGKFAWGEKRGSNRGAHRVAWLLSRNRDIPEGKDVLHRCDNPPCVNSDHLFLGTHSDNMRDMHAKGRWTPSWYVPEPLRGEASPQAKITASDVVDIRTLRAMGARQAVLAKAFGISQQLVSCICKRQAWKHVA